MGFFSKPTTKLDKNVIAKKTERTIKKHLNKMTVEELQESRAIFQERVDRLTARRAEGFGLLPQLATELSWKKKKVIEIDGWIKKLKDA